MWEVIIRKLLLHELLIISGSICCWSAEILNIKLTATSLKYRSARENKDGKKIICNEWFHIFMFAQEERWFEYVSVVHHENILIAETQSDETTEWRRGLLFKGSRSEMSFWRKEVIWGGGVTLKLQEAMLVLRWWLLTVECNNKLLMWSVVYSNDVYRVIDY